MGGASDDQDSVDRCGRKGEGEKGGRVGNKMSYTQPLHSLPLCPPPLSHTRIHTTQQLPNPHSCTQMPSRCLFAALHTHLLYRCHHAVSSQHFTSFTGAITIFLRSTSHSSSSLQVPSRCLFAALHTLRLLHRCHHAVSSQHFTLLTSLTDVITLSLRSTSHSSPPSPVPSRCLFAALHTPHLLHRCHHAVSS